jgi:hypothetical protein
MCNGRYWKQKGLNKNENQSSIELQKCAKEDIGNNGFRQEGRAKLKAQCTYYFKQAP